MYELINIEKNKKNNENKLNNKIEGWQLDPSVFLLIMKDTI